MTITPIAGERMCYYCKSDSSDAVYRVDLLAHGGRGMCGCVDWGTRHWPRIKNGERSMCKHLRCCREEFLNDLLERIAKEYE